MYQRFFNSLALICVQMVMVISIIGFLIDSGAKAMGYQWQWSRVPDYIAFYEDNEWWAAELLQGLFITLQITSLSLIFTLLIAGITALLKLSNSITGRKLASFYIELIRNTPLLVQVYLLYFVLGPILGLERFSTAILALSLFQGAYTAEVLRAGLNSLDKGQFEACKSLGLSAYASYRYVILPQVIQKTLPPLTNEAVSLVKNSAIVSVMAIFDLTTQARNLVSETAMPFEIWFTVAAIYLILTLSLSALAKGLERKCNTNK